MTVDTLFSDEGSLINQTVETAQFPKAAIVSKDEPNDLAQCQQIIRGMRQLILEKDAELQQMLHMSSQKGVGRGLPIEFQKDMNVLRLENNRLSQKTKELLDEKKYLERVQRDQGRELSKKKIETNQTTLKAQEDEIRHMRRKKYETQTQLDKLAKENMAIKETNRSMIIQLKERTIAMNNIEKHPLRKPKDDIENDR